MNTIMFNQQAITPSKVICVGRNYAKHIQELNNKATGDMVIFIKPNSSISEALNSYHQEPLHYEGEIALLVEGDQFVGIGFGLDLTKRQLQSSLKEKQLPWERAKSFDGSAVFSEFVLIPEAARENLQGLSLALYIDEVLIQRGDVQDMLFPPDIVLADVLSSFSLNSGDIIMTGTPQGVGEIRKGAVFEGKIFWQEQLLVSSIWVAQ